MDAAPASAVADMAEMLAGPNILHMVHSHAGAHVACHVLALGTAKQRKKVIKAMKGELTCPHSPSVFSLFATKRWSSLYGRPALADFAGQALLCAARYGWGTDLTMHSPICSRGLTFGLFIAEAAPCWYRAREGDV